MSLQGPKGFRSWTTGLGLREDGDDFSVLVSAVPAVSAAVFTRSRFAGPSVQVSREVAATGTARGVVTIAKNANVATGPEGLANAREVRDKVAAITGIAPGELLVSSTGVIGRQYPMDQVREGIDRLPRTLPDADLPAVATAMMTTDTLPKHVSARCGEATVAGVAKGVGMIEPNMATLLTYFCTDAKLEQPVLDRIFRSVIDRTFNALSIDTDTSTSDSAAIFANGLAGPVDEAEFEEALYQVALHLVRKIASDGEGASKLIEVRVLGARDVAQARRVGKTIVNSPLVKTAVHGADPNWGRVVMAIGKCEDDLDIEPTKVVVRFGEVETYPAPSTDEVLEAATQHLKGDEVVITVDLGIADGEFTVYGCDLTDGYIRINADYTT
ncbi:bifunctional glutamate N-acetyltransferase/amino-acid acetyltransferase ArgJ [Pseudonocardiaceae bacterium YIM PH 21723]|nr:bifunctional glutamate N-acetyltransferase/amino-acid acetyltransferase ArgJ [Pseudonocardiaceae bacterium YIM PH 21723]